MKIKFEHFSIIDRYITRQILLGLVIVSSVLLGIAWFSQIIRLLSYLVNNNLSILTFLRMTSLLLPELVVIILPVAIFAVVLFVYNRMVSDKELVIMEAVGMTPRMLARPALRVSLAAVLFSYFLTLYLSPIYSVKYRTFAFEAKNDLSALLIREGEFNQLTAGVTIYVRNASNNVLSDIFINDARSEGGMRTIIAERGVVTTGRNNIVLSLENGSIQEKSKGKYAFGSFSKYTADLGVIATAGTRSQKANELGFFELVFARELGYADESRYAKYLLELHSRLLRPLYGLIFVLIALIAVLKSSLGSRTGGRNTALAICAMAGMQMLFISMDGFLVMYRRAYPLVYLFVFAFILASLKILYLESPAGSPGRRFGKKVAR
jgi:lipopolysaccharide export system permease protein